MTENESNIEVPTEMPMQHQLGQVIAGTLAAFAVTKLVEKGYKAGFAALRARSAAKS